MGLITNETFYTYSDVTIVPSPISEIEHRAECIPFDDNGMLPIFTAPMDTVVSEANFDKFNEELIYPILPRTVKFEVRLSYSVSSRWAAYSLKEFEDTFCDEKKDFNGLGGVKVLIDVANGHMQKILDLVEKSKKIHGKNIIIMVGNIANPITYKYYAEVGVDFVRLSIGTGAGCLSSSNLGIHMPIASLISKTVDVKNSIIEANSYRYKSIPKIVADGGIRNYSDAIKALALGADYVMIGSVFAKMLESAAQKHCDSVDFVTDVPIGVTLSDIQNIHMNGETWEGEYDGKKIFLGNIFAKFYGMASKDGQIALNGKKTKTSEGLTKELSVDYTMYGWCDNFKDYLRSAMSYTNAKTLNDFKTKTTLVVNSSNAIAAVNK